MDLLSKFNRYILTIIRGMTHRSRFVLLISIDAILFALSFLGAIWLRFEFTIPEQYHQLLFKWIPIIIILKVIIYIIGKAYKRIFRYTSLYDINNLLILGLFSSATILVIFSIIVGLRGFPRSVFVIDLLFTFLFTSLSRILIRLFFSKIKKAGYDDISVNRVRLLLIGAGNAGEKLVREIVQSNNPNYKLVGILDDNAGRIGSTIHGIKIYGTIKQIQNLHIPFDEILIAIPSASVNQMREIVNYCKIPGKPIKTIPSINEIIGKHVLLNTMREFSYLDLIGREEVKLDHSAINEFLNNKSVLVTGGGGSIGSELARQILKFSPRKLVLLDNSELNSFKMKRELDDRKDICKIVLGDIRDKRKLEKIFIENKPNIVFHAAAYKHVPILNESPREAIRTNVLGTLNMVETSIKFGVNKFVLVSTDKAVNPISIMGMTKRIAELIIQNAGHTSDTSFVAVRFGNVLGSSGSVLPIFEEQIKNRRPITITHPKMKRYFMSISEAAQLIIQAGCFGVGSQIFILDMGEPKYIEEVANDLISLAGLRPQIDIPIEYTGIRPGEKLEEELFVEGELIDTSHPKILILKDDLTNLNWESFKDRLSNLISKADSFEDELTIANLQSIISDNNS